MLNRRILRIKAFKVLYSYAENPSMTLKEAEAELDLSCQATRNLYLFMLSIIPQLSMEASSRIEAARSKFSATAEEKNPDMRLVDSSIAKELSEDIDFQKIIKKLKLSWEQYDVLLRNLYDSILTKDYYSEYMSCETPSRKDEAAFYVHMFEEEFVDNKDLEDILEDLSIYWNDDLAYSLSWCCKTVTSLSEGKRWSLPPLYQSELEGSRLPDSDKAFVYGILRQAYLHFTEYTDFIASSVANWDRDRLFVTDQVLVIAGLAEASAFPEIPVRVTINEYVEISKYYGTPKSRSFVNGILDKLIKEHVQTQ